MRNRPVIQGIYAGLTVLVTLSLLLAMLEIAHLDHRVNALGTQVQADRAAAGSLNAEIRRLTATIKADRKTIAANKQTIQANRTEIIHLGGSPKTPAKTKPAAPKPKSHQPHQPVVPSPTPLPSPLPTLTCLLLGGCK